MLTSNFPPRVAPHGGGGIQFPPTIPDSPPRKLKNFRACGAILRSFSTFSGVPPHSGGESRLQISPPGSTLWGVSVCVFFLLPPTVGGNSHLCIYEYLLFEICSKNMFSGSNTKYRYPTHRPELKNFSENPVVF